MRWALNSDCRIHLRRWDDDTVIYDETTGGTHLLSPAAAEIFDMIARETLTAETIVARLAAQVGCIADEAFSSKIQETLEKLDMIELIRRLPD
jgi:PqqD family protein of HPr-rel-A system